MSKLLRKIRNEETFEQPTPSDYVSSRALVAGMAKTFTVPANLGTAPQVPAYALILGSDDFYYNRAATATVPGDVSDGTASVLVRKGDSVLVEVAPGDAFSVLTAASGGAIVQFWLYTRT